MKFYETNEELEKSFSFFMFSQPDIITGISRVLDLGSSFDDYNLSFNPIEDDAWATYADWYIVGCDMKKSLAKFPEVKNNYGRRK